MRRVLACSALVVAAALLAPAEAIRAESHDGSGEAAAEADAGPAEEGAAETEAKQPEVEHISVFELREQIDTQIQEQLASSRERLAAFEADRERQKRLLAEAKQTAQRTEAESHRLEKLYDQTQTQLEENQERLEQRLAELGELFGVVRQVATDTSGHVFVSLTTAELGPRKELLERLGRSKELPSTRDLERLWFELQREMTAQAGITRFSAAVLTPEGDDGDKGEKHQKEVVRAGPFVAVADGRYLVWEPGARLLKELPRQPPPRYSNTVAPFEEHASGFVPLAVDPSAGVLLEALTATPSILERLNQGGYVGYVIIALGLFGLLLGFARWFVVGVTSRRVSAQERRRAPSADNPLGRLLGAAEDSEELDAELLELRLDDVMLREASSVQRFLWIVRTVSVIAPLLGLLGTVTGMIQTFQAITLYGAGDPKMMASGISEALVTTMLGLITAIPLVLLYEALSNSTRRIIGVLEENSARLVAARSERDGHSMEAI